MGSKKFKWNRWPKFRAQWKHSMPYKSPVRMWTSKVVLDGYKEVFNFPEEIVANIKSIFENDLKII